MKLELRYRIMSFMIGMILCLFLISPTLCADTDSGSIDNSRHSLFKDSWSFQFAITEDFSLAPFKGAMLSAKKHLSSRSALRVGITINTDSKQEESYSMSHSGQTHILDRNTFTIEILCQYLQYKKSYSSLKMYWGIGPKFGFEYLEILYRTPDSDEFIWAGSYRHIWSLGIQTNWGVEWFISNAISLTAEYGAKLVYKNDMSIPTPYLIDREWHTNNSIELDATPVNLGLSVYF